MKYLFLISIIFIHSTTNKSPRQLFDDFHTIYAKGDFVAMDTLLADDFVGYNDEGEISFNRSEYLSYMQTWNQVFKTKWNVEEVKVVDGDVISIEYDTDLYNDYFYGNRHQVQYIYKFKENKIQSIRTIVTKIGQKSEERFDIKFRSFCIWVKDNYPEKLKYCTAFDKVSALEIKSLIEIYSKIVPAK